MAITITNSNGKRKSRMSIRATGRDASGLLIAMADDATLAKWQLKKTGSESFQKMVNEAIAARASQSVESAKSVVKES